MDWRGLGGRGTAPASLSSHTFQSGAGGQPVGKTYPCFSSSEYDELGTGGCVEKTLEVFITP